MYLLLGRGKIEIGFCCFLTIDLICQALLMPLEGKEKIFIDFLLKHFCRILSMGSTFCCFFFSSGLTSSPPAIILGTMPVLEPRKIGRDPGAERAVTNEDSITPGALLSPATVPNAQHVFLLTVSKAPSLCSSVQVWSPSKDPS